MKYEVTRMVNGFEVVEAKTNDYVEIYINRRNEEGYIVYESCAAINPYYAGFRTFLAYDGSARFSSERFSIDSDDYCTNYSDSVDIGNGVTLNINSVDDRVYVSIEDVFSLVITPDECSLISLTSPMDSATFSAMKKGENIIVSNMNPWEVVDPRNEVA